MRLRILLTGLTIFGAAPAVAAPDAVTASFSAACGQAFAGRVVTTDAADRDFASQPLVMQLRLCADGDVRIPFHVGDDRSRTWLLTRTETGYRLKHRHIHADGKPDVRTNYGGDHVGPPRALPGGGWRLEFPADAESKALFVAQGIPASAANVWAVEHVPGKLFVYELRRPERFLRVEFDLGRKVPAPPAPWGVPVEISAAKR